MEHSESPIIHTFRRLVWTIYTSNRLFGLIGINALLTLAFIYVTNDLSPDECTGIPRTFLSIAKYYYLAATIYFLMTLSSRLRIMEEFSSRMEVGPTKAKLDVSDLVFLVVWLGLNTGMVVSYFCNGDCPAAYGLLLGYFIGLILGTALLVIGLCCVGWFAAAVIHSNKAQQHFGRQNREMDEYIKI